MSDTEQTRHQATVEAIGLANDPKPATAAPEAPKEEQPAAATPEEEAAKAEAAEQAEEEADESATSDGNESPERRVRRNRMQERIDQITREKYELAARAEAAEQYLARLTEQQQQAQQQTSTKPTLDGCGYDQDVYEAELVKWAQGQARTEAQQQFAQQAAQRAQQERQSRVSERVQALEKESPGAWEKAITAPINYTPYMVEAMAESDLGPKIGVYLADHLDEAHRITRMTPVQQLVALGRIEQQLSHTAPAPTPTRVVPKTVTNAPPPAPVLQSAAKVNKPLSEQSIDDRIAAIREAEARL